VAKKPKDEVEFYKERIEFLVSELQVREQEYEQQTALLRDALEKNDRLAYEVINLKKDNQTMEAKRVKSQILKEIQDNYA